MAYTYQLGGEPMDLDLNIFQTIFALFFAIMWGGMANVLARWKAFDTGRALRDDYARRRLWLSIAVLTALPILFFALTVLLLSSCPWNQREEWHWLSAFLAFGLVAFAGGAPLGFYRIWLFWVQWKRDYFYPKNEELKKLHCVKNLDEACDLDGEAACPNLVWGLVYHLAIPFVTILVINFVFAVRSSG